MTKLQNIYSSYATADFIKKKGTHSTETIYLSLSAQVAVCTFFMKSPFVHFHKCIMYVQIFSE